MKASKSSGEERRLSYDAVRRRHHTSDQDKLLVEEEDEADKADDEKDDEGNHLLPLLLIYSTEIIFSKLDTTKIFLENTCLQFNR